MSEIMPAGHEMGKPARESNAVIGLDAQGNETVLPGLAAGDGVDTNNPPPGSQGWKGIVQAGLDSAAAADPPAQDEIDLWTRVAKDRIPLDYVKRNPAGGLSLTPPQAGEKDMTVDELMDKIDDEMTEGEIIEMDKEVEYEPPFIEQMEQTLRPDTSKAKGLVQAIAILIENETPLDTVLPLFSQLKDEIDKL
jgi:hypothetical protein